MRPGALALVVAAIGMAAVGCSDEVPPSFQWQSVQADLPGAMLSVWGTTAQDIYAVGADANDGTGPQALHFDGTRWTRIDTGLGRGSLWWVHGISPTLVFMVGSDGTVLRHNPATGATERMTTPATTPTLFGVWGASANDVWAVGGDINGSTGGALWHYDGTAWSAQAAPGGMNATTTWYKVNGTAANDVTVCGTNGALLHWNGSVWEQQAAPEGGRGPLFTVYQRGTQRYAVGGNVSGIILESEGTGAWRSVAVETAPRLSGVYIPAEGSPLAVGNSGALFQRRSGAWREVARAPRTQLDFHAVWVDPTGAVWAVGGDLQTSALTRGVIYRFGEAIPRTTIVTPESITRCDQTPGNICTYAGAGVAGYNGEGRPLRESMMYWPMDMEFGPDGRPIILDWNNHRIRRVTAADTFETIMGVAEPGDGPPMPTDLVEPGAPGDTVALNHPTDLMFAPDGRLLVVAWHNHKIRRWDPVTGMTFVPLGRGPGWIDGPFAMARVKQPSKGVLDPSGTVMYLLDQGNGRVRRLDLASQMVTTIAGNGMRAAGGDNGPALMASFNLQSGENPEPEGGIAIDRDGRNLYVSDTGNHRIRRIELATGTITTVAGTGAFGFGGDNGPALMAQLSSPQDIEFGPDGRLFIADTNNHRIRALDLATGTITTVAGSGVRGYGGDRGPALQAALYRPHGIAFDAQGNLFICDTLNDRVRRVWR